MPLTVILVECDVTSPAGVVKTLRFSDRAVFPMAPTDADRPDIAWDERLIETPSLKRTLFDDLQSLEPGLGVGAMVLANADRALDPYQGYVWGEVRVWRWTYGTPFSTAKPLMTGLAAGTPGYDVTPARAGRVRLTLFDYRIELERPLQTHVYSGDNDGVAVFFEGDDSLRGKLKPLSYGNLLNAHIPGAPINHTFAGYQLHDGAMLRPNPASGYQIQIFDRGGDAGIVAGGSDLGFFFPDVSILPGFAIGSGSWFAFGDAGMLKFDSNPVGAIAFGLRGDAAGGYVETTGPILARILSRIGVPAGRIGPGVAALASSAIIGAYIDQATTAREMVSWVSKAAPAALIPDRFGVWTAILLTPPGDVASYTIEGSELLGVEADDAGPQGAGEIGVGWDRIWTTYRRDNLQAELLGTAAEMRLQSEYRYVTVEDAPFQARFPAAWRKVKVDTPLRNEVDAQALASKLQALFGLRGDGRPRRQWRVTIEMTDAVMAIELGATVAIAAPEFGITDRYLLIGEEAARPRRDQIIWTLWG